MYVNCDTAKKYILIINFFARGVADKGKIKKRKRVTLISSPDNVLYYSDSQTASIIESDASQGLCIDHHFDCSTLKPRVQIEISMKIYTTRPPTATLSIRQDIGAFSNFSKFARSLICY